MERIFFKQQSVYGKVLIYPVCERAIIFTKLIGKKTFTVQDLQLIQSLGYEIAMINTITIFS